MAIPAKLFQIVPLPDISSSMHWSDLLDLESSPSSVRLMVQSRDKEPLLARVKIDAQLLLGLQEGVTPIRDTPPTFPWVFEAAKTIRNVTKFKGIGTNDRDTALRMTLIQTAVATFNACGKLKTDSSDYKIGLANAYMMATLADKVQEKSTTDEYNPDAVHWQYDNLIALLVELKSFEYLVATAGPQSAKAEESLLSIGKLVIGIQRGPVKSSAWTLKIKQIAEWHRVRLALFLAKKLVATEAVGETTEQVAMRYAEAEDLLVASGGATADPALYQEVKTFTRDLGWNHHLPSGFKPQTWTRIVTGVYFTGVVTQTWCEKCRSLEANLLISRLFPGVHDRYIKVSNPGVKLTGSKSGSGSDEASSEESAAGVSGSLGGSSVGGLGSRM